MIQLPGDTGCYVCGELNKKGFNITFYADDNLIVAFFESCAEYKGHGPIHGGVSAALLDEAMGLAVTVLKKTLCVTAEISFRYLKPMHVNGSYTVRGKVIKDRKLLCETYGDIIDAKNNLYIKAFGKYVPLSEERSYKLRPDIFFGQ